MWINGCEKWQRSNNPKSRKRKSAQKYSLFTCFSSENIYVYASQCSIYFYRVFGHKRNQYIFFFSNEKIEFSHFSWKVDSICSVKWKLEFFIKIAIFCADLQISDNNKKQKKIFETKINCEKVSIVFHHLNNRLKKCVRIDGVSYRCISDFNPSAANKISRFQPFFKPYYLEMNSGNIFSMKHTYIL